MFVDRAAYAPKNSVKPDRRMIVGFGVGAGMFLGIFIVFLISLYQIKKGIHS